MKLWATSRKSSRLFTLRTPSGPDFFGPHTRISRQMFVSLKYSQQDATFSRSIYFYKLLYMFQAVPPPIIRSTKLYIQRQVLSNQYCCLLQLVWQYLALYIQFCAPDDGRRNGLKHVEQFIEINRSRKSFILLVVL